jgi:hypothetical protein
MIAKPNRKTIEIMDLQFRPKSKKFFSEVFTFQVSGSAKKFRDLFHLESAAPISPLLCVYAQEENAHKLSTLFAQIRGSHLA